MRVVSKVTVDGFPDILGARSEPSQFTIQKGDVVSIGSHAGLDMYARCVRVQHKWWRRKKVFHLVTPQRNRRKNGGNPESMTADQYKAVLKEAGYHLLNT